MPASVLGVPWQFYCFVLNKPRISFHYRTACSTRAQLFAGIKFTETWNKVFFYISEWKFVFV